MSYRKLFLLYSFILFLLLSRNLRSETNNSSQSGFHAGPGTPIPQAGKNPQNNRASNTPPPATAAPDSLSDRSLLLFSDLFPIPPAMLKDTFAEITPFALDQLVDGKEEEPVAMLTAVLMGTASDARADRLEKILDKKIEAGKKDGSDKKFLALLKRLKWAKIIAMEPRDGATYPQRGNREFEAFRSAFLPAWKKVKEGNEAFHRHVAKINNASTAQRALLRDELLNNYDRRGIPAFLDDGGSFADDLGNALAFEKDGKRFIDIIGPDGRRERILLPENEPSIGPTLADFRHNRGSLIHFTANDRPHDVVDSTYLPGGPQMPVAKQRSSRSVLSPTPISNQAEDWQRLKPPAPREAAAAEGENSVEPRRGPVSRLKQRSRPTDRSKDPAIKRLDAQVRGLLKTNCAECHGPESKNKQALKNFALDLTGAPTDGVNLAQMVSAVELEKMPPEAPLDEFQIEALKDWAFTNGTTPAQIEEATAEAQAKRPLAERKPRP